MGKKPPTYIIRIYMNWFGKSTILKGLYYYIYSIDQLQFTFALMGFWERLQKFS